MVRAQALLLTGLSYKVEGDLVSALKYLESSSKVFMSDVAFEKQFRNRGLAQALTKTGDMYRVLMEKIPLRLPVERMEIDIQDKLAIHRKAEEVYQDAARGAGSILESPSGISDGPDFESHWLWPLCRRNAPGILLPRKKPSTRPI